MNDDPVNHPMIIKRQPWYPDFAKSVGRDSVEPTK
jgi:hypothetical protein